MPDWHSIANVAELPTPALAVYPQRIRENIRRMIAIAGGPEKLWPHVKTHKLAEVVRMQLDQGITKFKSATIAEAEMLGRCGVSDALVACAPVGPNVARLRRLCEAFPATRFATVGDDPDAIRSLSKEMSNAAREIDVYLDIDTGFGRTGVAADERALRLVEVIDQSPGLRFAGLHVYDGEIRDPDPAARKTHCDAAFSPAERLREQLAAGGRANIRVIAGGTPTFPIHATRPNVECSPGTLLLWDAGYGERYADLDFLHAAAVVTRIVSKPGRNRLTLDLGYKSLSADAPPPRVRLIGLTDATFLFQNEEFLTLETEQADARHVGEVVYGIPLHICPTVALHAQAAVAEQGRVVGQWNISARDRVLTI